MSFRCPWCSRRYDIPYDGSTQPCSPTCPGGGRGNRASLQLASGKWVRAGDWVVYLYTEGGGGGSGKRPNVKSAKSARINRIGPKNVRITFGGRSTWVRPENLQ